MVVDDESPKLPVARWSNKRFTVMNAGVHERTKKRIHIKTPVPRFLNVNKSSRQTGEVGIANVQETRHWRFFCRYAGLFGYNYGSFSRNYVHNRPFIAAFAERYGTVDESKQRMIAAQPYVFAGVVFGAPLTNDNVTCDGRLTTENFDAQSLADAITAVLRTTDAFLVCHIVREFNV